MRTLPAFLGVGLALACGCGPDPRISPPAWNAAGDRAAFVRYAESGEPALYLLDPGGQDEPRLVARSVERFAFAGNRLYFLRPAAAAAAADAPKAGLYGVDLLRREPGEPQLMLEPPEGAAFETLGAAPRGLLYLGRREEDPAKSAILEFDPANEQQRVVSPRESGCFWPAVAPRGSELAWLAAGRGGAAVEVFRRPLPAGEPALLARLPRARPDTAALAWGPAGDKLLVWYVEGGADEDGQPRLALLEPARGEKGLRHLELPRPEAPVLAAALAPDGARAFVTVLTRDRNERLGTESFDLDLAAGKARPLGAAAGRLLGARGYAPDGKRWLEFTPAGLALFEAGDKEPRGAWPLDGEERSAVGRRWLAAGQSDRALAVAQAGLDRPGPEDDRQALQLLKSEALAAAGAKPAEVSGALMEGLLRFPVAGAGPADAEIAERLEKLADEQPENRLLAALAAAWKLRAEKRPAEAAAAFQSAATLSADRAWSAGLRFRAAESWLAAGRGVKAGELFRKASDVEEFPQADWAAGLAALAYAVGGHEQLAVENAQRGRDLFGKGLLGAELVELHRALAAGACRPRVAGQARAPEGTTGAAVRAEAWPMLAAHCSFARSRPAAGAAARLALVRGDRWRLVLAGGGRGAERVLLDRLSLPVASLSFSPDGKMFAFLAGEEGRRSLYAADAAGQPVLGDWKKLQAGELDPVTAAADCRWPDNGGLPEPVRNR